MKTASANPKPHPLGGSTVIQVYINLRLKFIEIELIL